MEATNRTERFADYINAMDFSQVIEFFSFMMTDMMQIENHRMFDWTQQEDAERILKGVGITSFVMLIKSNTPEERGVMWSIDQAGCLNFEAGFNPWTEILDGYSDWILGHLDDCMKGVKDKTAIIEKYPDIFDKVMEEPMKSFVVQIVETAIYHTIIKAKSQDEAVKKAEEKRPDYRVWEDGRVSTEYTAKETNLR